MKRLLFTCALMALVPGCITGETGSRTVIGNHFALPKLSTPSGDVEIMVYESTEGASVTTRKDSRVEISYSNHYTNTVLGVWNKRGEMVLTVKVEPLQTTTEEPCSEK